MDGIDSIYSGNQLIATIVKNHFSPDATSFVTGPDENLQVGFVVYPKDGAIQPHVHVPMQRQVEGTGEVLIIKAGKCTVFLYDNDRSLIAERLLEQGDVLILVSGGHGFKMHADTILLEVKQGPYTGLQEKERF